MLILGRDIFKEMLVDIRCHISEELFVHLPQLVHVGELGDFNMYESPRYARLTKKNWPNAYVDYEEIQACMGTLMNNSALQLARLAVRTVKHTSALAALWELSNLAISYSKRAHVDCVKRNFMVNPDTGELILNDLFFEPKRRGIK